MSAQDLVARFDILQFGRIENLRSSSSVGLKHKTCQQIRRQVCLPKPYWNRFRTSVQLAHESHLSVSLFHITLIDTDRVDSDILICVRLAQSAQR
jgi:hypothetical protein